nr:MarR family winged helix-turn-helix transcriptional regulator [Roseibium aestuarii]
MADVNFKTANPPASPDGDATPLTRPELHPDEPVITPHCDLIELLFYAYRDFTSDPDERLAAFDFGRAHHRVLHFVDRNPGMMVTDLLAILRITKQSLGRVLKQLVDKDFILQKPGPLDRRQRLLYTTPTGHALARSLSSPQSERLSRALATLPPGSDDIVRQFLHAMIDEDARDAVAEMIYNTDRPARSLSAAAVAPTMALPEGADPDRNSDRK